MIRSDFLCQELLKQKLLIEYLEYCSYKNLRLKTIKSYHQTLMLFAKYLEEELEITDIKKGQ